MDVIINPCWDYTEFMLVKGAPGKRLSSAIGFILGNIYWVKEYIKPQNCILSKELDIIRRTVIKDSSEQAFNLATATFPEYWIVCK